MAVYVVEKRRYSPLTATHCLTRQCSSRWLKGGRPWLLPTTARTDETLVLAPCWTARQKQKHWSRAFHLDALKGVITYCDTCTDRLLEEPAIDADADAMLTPEFHTAPFE